jgi:hypothetical protein
MSDLSYYEEIALAQIREERDHFKAWVLSAVKANPSISEEDLRAELLALDDPYPNNAFGIRDRSALLDAYILGAGGYPYMVGLMITYPEWVVMQLAPELGKPLPTPAQADLMALRGDTSWGVPNAPDYRGPYGETRNPVTHIVTEEFYEGTHPEKGFLVLKQSYDADGHPTTLEEVT